MKRFLVFFWFFLTLAFFSMATPVLATCKKDITDAEKASFPIQTSFSLSTDEFATCKPEDTAARGVQPNVPYTVHCQEESEKCSFFSLKAALCGSSDERGPNNATCWTCGGDLRCTGFGQFALCSSDPFIAPPVGERLPVNPGDTNMSQVWRVSGSSIPQSGFTYNGLHYDKPPGDLIVCTSDNRACGASDISCSGRFPEIPPEGTGGRVERILANPGSNPGDPIPGFIRLNFLGALGTWLTRQIAATIRYENDIHEGMTDFGRIGTMVENAAIKPLMPGALQPEYSPVDAGDKPGRYPLRGVSLYRLCIDGSGMAQPDGDPQDDNVPLRGATLTEGTLGFSSPNPRFWPQSISGSRLLTTYFLHDAAASGVDFVAPNGDPVEIESIDDNGRIFYDTPNMSQVDDAAYDCGSRTDGAPLRNVDTDAGGEARTALPPTGSSGGFFAWLTEVTARIFPPSQLTSCGPDDPRETCANVPWEVVRSDYIPADLAVVSQFIGLTPDQLSPNMPFSDRVEIARDGGSNELEPGGWTRTLLPQSVAENIDYPHANAPQGQSFLSGLLGGVSGNFDAYPRWLKGVTDAFTCTVDNMIIPSALQTRACPWDGQEPPLSEPNTSTWAISQTISSQPFTPSGDFAQLIQQFSAETGVPQCVIQGVANIEGGDRYDELPVDQCLNTTNTCSAVGPMQFTVGPGHGQATEEVCRTQCAAGYCPNAWARYGNNGNPCSYTDSLSAASRYLADYGHFDGSDLQDSVHDATTAYYGSDNNALARNVLGGCEYWEYVYRTCEPSYVCQANR